MCIAIGDTDSSVNILSSGDASIKFNSWCSQQLNVLLAYLSRMYYLKIGTLACAGAQGWTGEDSGGFSYFRSPIDFYPGILTPKMMH